MIFAYSTPILGILNDTDAPHQNMVAVVFGKPGKLRWCYVAPRHGGNSEHEMREVSPFVPLTDFGVHATLTPDGCLALNRLTISVARYPNGNARHWQGADKCVMDIHRHIAGHVVGAVHLGFEARRARAEAAS